MKPKAMPIPEKGQDRATYEKEELSKPLYEGKVTFEMVANDPEYQTVRDHPNWKAMLAMDEKETAETPKDDAKMPAGNPDDVSPPTAPPKQDKPSAPTKAGEGMTDLDVTEEGVPDIPDMEIEPAQPKEAKYGGFSPHYRIKEVQINNKLELEVAGPLHLVKGSGFDDLLNDSKLDLDSSKEERLYAYLQEFAAPMRVKGMSRDDVYVPFTAHNISPEFAPQRARLDLLEYSVSRVNDQAVPLLENANVGTFNGIVNGDQATAIPVANLAFLGGARGEEVVAQDVFINPHRLPLILAGLRTHRHVFMRRDAYLNPVMNPLISDQLLRDVRQRNGGEEDKISNNSARVSVFEKPDFDGGRYYYDLNQVNDLRLYSEIVERSIATCRGYTDVITPSASMLSFTGSRQVMETVAKLNQLGSGDAATMARELTTFYASGYGCELDIDFSSMLTGDVSRIRPLCCMAYLLMLDKTMLAYDAHHKLLTGILAPFYDEVNGPEQNVAGGVRVRLGAATLASEILANGGVRDDKRNLTVNFSLLLGGKRIADIQRRERDYVVDRLAELINLSFRVVHNRIPRQRALFGYDRVDAEMLRPYSPFVPAPGASESVNFGDTPHYTADYEVEMQATMNNLKLFSDILSRRPEVGQMLPLMQDALSNIRKPARSAAIMVSAIVKATTETDCIPYRGNVRNRGALPLQTFTLPFAGALSFLLFGVESSELIDDNEKYLRFIPMTSVRLPSLYPSYVYLEKAIANEIFERFRQERFHILIPKKLVNLALEVLSVIYSKVDPASERRLTLMFDEYTRFLMAPNNGEIIPEFFKMASGVLRDAIARTDMRGDVKYGLAKKDAPADGAPVGVLEPLQHAIYLKKRRVDEVYISVNASVPNVTHLNVKGQAVALYVYETAPPEGETINLDTVLNELYSTQEMDYQVDSIRQIARQLGAEYVKIDKLKTKINLVEQTGFTDEPTPEPTIKVSRRKERAERKFEIDSINVYYRLNHNEYSRDAAGVPARGMLNAMFRTSIGMTYDSLMRYVANYDGFKFDDPTLYDIGQRLRIMDGQGLIHSTPVRIATREREEFIVEQAINFRM